MTEGAATDVERIEHVTLHSAARPCAVVGVYVHAATLAAAEAAAARAWGRAVLAHPLLALWRLQSAEVPLLRPGLDD
ncbi:hypothetical protein [Streptomyces sp. NPDC013455]|uniref:hypothetical protein n=1 Tax=Streptomyces sp. NPDC013455 TaxID=3155605 RepID=UPI0033F3925A